MNLKHSFFIAFLTFLIPACKSSDNGLYEFDPRKLEENRITLSEVADEVTYIPIDNSFPLGEIFYNITFTIDAIYFPSRDIGILTFDREGKFVKKISSIGRGPGEYSIYRWFSVDDQTGIVYIVDRGSIVKVYSRTGQFLKSFSLNGYGDMVDNISFYNSKLFVSYAVQYENAKYEWIVFDTLGNVIKKKEREIPLFTANWGGSRPIYIFENRLSYYNNFTDTVFSILPDLTEVPSFIITPGEHRAPRSNLTLEQIMQNKFMDLDIIFETSRFIVIRYLYHKQTLALIDKHNQKSFLVYFEYDDSGDYPKGGIVNDLDGGPPFLPKDYYAEKGREYMIGLIYPYQIKFLVSSNEFINSTPKYPEKKKELEKLANSLKETDNPVLMLVKLKK